MEVRVATEQDIGGVTATLAAAFAVDPLWSWAFPSGGLAELWSLLIRSAVRLSLGLVRRRLCRGVGLDPAR